MSIKYLFIKKKPNNPAHREFDSSLPILSSFVHLDLNTFTLSETTQPI